MTTPWLDSARAKIGTLHDGQDVVRLAQDLAKAFPDQASYWAQATPSTSWCGILVAHELMLAGVVLPGPHPDGIGAMYVNWWLDFGTPITLGHQQPGDIAIFLGNPHHVTFVSANGYIGGNQSDGVTEAHFRTPDAIRRVPQAGVAAPSQDYPHSGKGSWYSQFVGKYTWVDTGDAPGSAALGCPDDAQGVSFYDRSTLGHWFEVLAPNGVHSIEQQTDIGPSPNTGRLIDISAAAAERFGYSPRNFPTNSVFSWRAIDAPASVAGLTPKQQATAFRDLRKGSTMTDTTQPAAPATPPAPAPTPATHPDFFLNAMAYFMKNPDSFQRMAAFIAATTGAAPAAAAPSPTQATPAPAATPAPTQGGILSQIIGNMGGGSSATALAGIAGLALQVGLTAFGIAPPITGGGLGTLLGTASSAAAGGGLVGLLGNIVTAIKSIKK